MKNYDFKQLTLLIIEDDEKIRSNITYTLSHYFKEVFNTASAEEGLTLFQQHLPDILVVDIHLNGISGLEFIKRIRKLKSMTPIVVISAYTDTEYLLSAIPLNLIDYLIKPVLHAELFEVLGRCAEKLTEVKMESVTLSPVSNYLPQKKVLKKDGEEVSLSNKEIHLLEFFIKNRNKVLNYSIIKHEVWGDDSVTDNAVIMAMKKLRKKAGGECFSNIPRVGYILQ